MNYDLWGVFFNFVLLLLYFAFFASYVGQLQRIDRGRLEMGHTNVFMGSNFVCNTQIKEK